MARSTHSVLTGADRFERRAARRPRTVTERRTTTRSAIIRAEILQASA